MAALPWRLTPLLVFVTASWLPLAASAQGTNLGANPILNSGTQTLNLGDTFSGTFTINAATLNLGTNFTAPASTSFLFTANGSYLSYSSGGPYTLTLPSGTSLTRSNTGGSGYTYVYDGVSNSGNVTVSGGTLQFQSGTTFTNASGGTTTVTGSGSTLYLQGLANSGTLSVDTNGLIQLAGNFTTSGLGSFTTATGGAVQLTGALNNSSATLSLPSGTALTLAGGTITGGSITNASLALSTSGGTLDGATVNGNLSVGSSQTVTLKNSAGFTGTATVNAGTIYLGSNLSANAGSSLVFTGNGSYLSYGSGGPYTLTLPATSSLTRSGASGYTYVYDSLSNSGNVTISGGTLQFQSGTTLTNASTGVTTVTGTGSTLYLQGLANSGTLSVDTNGLVQLAGNFTTSGLGSFTTATGGAVQLTGTLNNSSATLSLPSGTALTLAGGTITGGSITSASLALSTSGGALDGATVNGNLSVGSNQSVTLKNSAGFTGTATVNAGTIYLGSNLSANTGNSLVFTGNGSYLSYGSGGPYTLTLPATTSLTRSNSGGSGYTYVYDNLTNSGTVTVSGGTLQFQSGTTLTNNVGATTTVTGSGSTLYLQGLANSGTLGVDTNGLVQLAGSFTSAGLGVLTIASGGAITLTGTLTNTSLAAPTGGAITLSGGTITGGTIAAGALSFTSSGGYLDNASLLDNLTLPANAYVRFTNGGGFTGATATLGNNAGVYWQQVGTLASKAITMNPGSYLYVAGANHTLTLDSATTATGQLQIYTDGSSGAAITNQGNLTHSTSSGSIYAPTLSNTGSITNTSANNYLVFGSTSSGYNTSNTGGTITVNGAGSTIYLDGNFINTGGTLTATNGQFIFRGNNTAAHLNGGTLNLASGTHAYLNGTIDNTSATLNAPTSGSYELYGGTITGGTIPAGALAFTSSGGYLDGASLADNLSLPANAYVRVTNGANFTGSTGTFGANAGLYWQQTGTLTGKSLTLGSGAYVYVAGANNTLTLASSTSLTGNANVYSDGSTGTAITNQGNITNSSGSAQISARSLSNTGSITNTSANNYLVFGSTSSGYNSSNTGGTITVNGSGSTIYLDGNFTNAGGTLTATNGQFIFRGNSTSGNLNAGTLNIASGAHAYLNGTINNTSVTLNAPTSGTYELYGGTITGGTIASGALTFTSSGGYLDGATFAGNLTLPANAYVRFANGASFTGSSGSLGNNAGIYWQQAGTLASKSLALGSGAYLYVAGANNTLTLDSATTVSGNTNIYSDGSSGTAITNQGNITNSSGSAQISARSLSNTGSITNTSANNYVVVGSTSSGYNTSNTGGTITVNGSGSTIYLDGNLTATGGTLTATNGQFIFRGNNTSTHLNGGTLNIASGAHAYLNGTIDNTSATLNAPTSGSYELYGGTILGGSIALGALGFTTSGGYLDGASLLDNLTLGNSAYARFLNGANFTGAIGTFGSNAGLYWQQSGTLAGKSLTFGSNAYLYVVGANNTLTLAPSTSLTGGANVYSDLSAGTTITNQGNLTHTTGTGSLYATSFTNSGTITATNGTLYLGYPSSSSSFTNAANANIVVNGSSAIVWVQTPTASPFTNAGSIAVQSGSLGSSSPITNSGNITIAAGTTFNDTSGTSFTQTAGALKIDGTFNAPSGGATISGGSVGGAGTVVGNLAFTGGTFSPGNPTGTFTITGNLTLASTSTLIMELGAATNDHITINGSANTFTFDGTLNIVALSNTFTSGQTWNLFSFPNHTGNFTTINLPYTNQGWVWDTSQLTTTGNLTLTTYVALPIPEPSTYALLAAGLGFICLLRRRKR